MAEELGWVGEEVDLVVRQGQTFALDLVLEREDGTKVDLTGATLVGQVRRRPTATSTSATFAVEVLSAELGEVRLSLAHETTAALACGRNLYDADSTYVYDVELHNVDGTIDPVCWGMLRVHREVTRG